MHNCPWNRDCRSISMTTCSTILALGMMPLCLLIYTSIWTQASSIQIPYDSIGITLASILIPIGLGMYVKHKWPHMAKKILKIGSIVGIVLIIIVAVVGGILYQSSWVIAPSLWIIGTVYPFIGFGLGLLLARFVGQSWSRCRTIALETGLQNAQLASTVIQLSFSPADLELMFAFPLIFNIFQLVMAFLAVAVYQAYKRSQGRGSSKADGEPGNVEPAKVKEHVMENGGFQSDNFSTEGMYKSLEKNTQM